VTTRATTLDFQIVNLIAQAIYFAINLKQTVLSLVETAIVAVARIRSIDRTLRSIDGCRRHNSRRCIDRARIRVDGRGLRIDRIVCLESLCVRAIEVFTITYAITNGCTCDAANDCAKDTEFGALAASSNTIANGCTCCAADDCAENTITSVATRSKILCMRRKMPSTDDS